VRDDAASGICECSILTFGGNQQKILISQKVGRIRACELSNDPVVLIRKHLMLNDL
jgi:hypothetical protein